jgi:hypothetical protein
MVLRLKNYIDCLVNVFLAVNFCQFKGAKTSIKEFFFEIKKYIYHQFFTIDYNR